MIGDDVGLCTCCGEFHAEPQADEPDSLCACCGDDHADRRAAVQAVLCWRLFTYREIREAEAWAKAGGIALHLSQPAGTLIWTPPGRGKPCECAHLFGPDRATLTAAAVSLGQKPAWIQHPDHPTRMHFDLWGKPLAAAKRRCKQEEAAATAAATPTLFDIKEPT